MAHNINVPLNQQNANADSSRAGQWCNGVGYVGVSSPTYGTLTVFRQNSLTLDGVLPTIRWAVRTLSRRSAGQGTTCGVGNTEDCRFSTALKYRVNVGMFRAAGLWQFGGYGQNNAADGAYQAQVGADISHLAGGTLSVDAIYSYVRDAAAFSLTGNPTNAERAADSAVHAAVSHGDDLQQHQRDGACQIHPRTAESLWRLRMDSIRAAQRPADLLYQYRGRFYCRASPPAAPLFARYEISNGRVTYCSRGQFKMKLQYMLLTNAFASGRHKVRNGLTAMINIANTRPGVWRPRFSA